MPEKIQPEGGKKGQEEEDRGRENFRKSSKLFFYIGEETNKDMYRYEYSEFMGITLITSWG